jgi:endonuclease/exonuclease/phosphatase family metal-dependent hydrolase
MPWYTGLRKGTKSDEFIVERLLALRRSLKEHVPKRTLKDNLLLATWNIREFDSLKYGKRTKDANFFIAEIISHFDIIAVQEVRKDLKGLKKVMSILGKNWDYLITDVTEGQPGNKERMAFLYDTRKVSFGGLASEIVLPPQKTKDADGNTLYLSPLQISRTPFMCGFKAGWTDFTLVTVHMLYGTSNRNDPKRVAEIKQIAEFLEKRSSDETAWSRNFILLGDFNIFKKTDETMKALLDAGFKIPSILFDIPTNIKENRIYDQIAFRTRDDRFADASINAGVFRFYRSVFRAEDESRYVKGMGKRYNEDSKGNLRKAAGKTKYYKTHWRTHQMSDHYPLWIELKIDYTDKYLSRKIEGDN